MTSDEVDKIVEVIDDIVHNIAGASNSCDSIGRRLEEISETCEGIESGLSSISESIETLNETLRHGFQDIHDMLKKLVETQVEVRNTAIMSLRRQ